MSGNETNKPFVPAFEKARLVLALPDESIVNEALRLKSLSNHEQASLNETLSAKPEVNVDSVKELIKSFQLTYEELKIIVEELSNGQLSSLPSIHEENIEKAQKLFLELNRLKHEIEEALINEATLNPTTGPIEEPGVLPTGNEYILSIPNGAIPGVFYDIETQRPLTPEERESLKIYELYWTGSKEAWFSGGKTKPLSVVRDEVRIVLSLGGYRSGQINEIFVTKINPITDEIRRLDTLQGKNKKDKLVEIYERVVKVVQEELKDRNHRFREADSAPKTDVSHTPTLPLQDVVDGGSTITLDNTALGRFKYENVPILPLSDIVPDPLLKKPTASENEAEPISVIPTLTDQVDNLPDYVKTLADLDYKFVLARAQLWPVVRILDKLDLVDGNGIRESITKFIEGYKDCIDVDELKTLQNKTEYIKKFETFLEEIRTVKVKGVNDGEFEKVRVVELKDDEVLVQRVSDGEKLTVSLAELKELNSPATAPDQKPADVVLPGADALPDTATASPDANLDPVVAPPAPDTTSPDVKDVKAGLDINNSTNPEIKESETLESIIEKFTEVKKRYLTLIELVSKDRILAMKFYWIPSRATPIIGAVDYIKEESTYTTDKKLEKIRVNAEALSRLNNLMSDDLNSSATPTPIGMPTSAPEATQVSATTPEPLPTPAPVVDVGAEAEKAAWREKVGLSRERTVVDNMPSAEREQKRNEYARERTLALEAKKDFKEAENNYQTKLKEFYENRGIFNRAAGSIRTLFGGQPKLPPELFKLQTIYKYSKQQYAKHLRDVLDKRAGVEADNKTFDEASISSKEAFGKKFVIDPRLALLQVQAEAYDNIDQNSKLKPIMAILRKHRTPLRWAGLFVAATAGAYAGGAVVAGVNMARWGLSTFGGMAVAKNVYDRKEKGVTEAVKNFDLGKEKVRREYELAKINELDDSFADDSLGLERAKLIQKVSAAGSAIVAGGAANLGASLAESYVGGSVDTTTRPTAGGKVSEDAISAAERENIRLAHEEWTRKVEKNLERLRELVAESDRKAGLGVQNVSLDERTGTPLSEVAPASMEVTPQTFMQMGEVKIPRYSPNGELLSNITVSNIRLEGANLGGLTEHALPDKVVVEVYSYINMRVNDILSAHPNFSQAQLEKELFKDLENVYGSKDWWTSAKITEVKIESIVNLKPGASAVVPKEIGLKADVSPLDSIGEGEAILAENTTLDNGWGVSNENTVVAEVTSPQASPEPLKYTRTGGLNIEGDGGVRSVPIAFNAPEVISSDALATPVSFKEIIEPVAVRPELSLPIPPEPDLYTMSGNYTKSPDFVAYVNSEYGSVGKFERIVLNKALEIENAKYDFLNKWLNEYKSPYELSLAKMSLADLKEAFGGPEVGARVVEVDSTGLPTKYDTTAIRQYAADNNFNYETVRNWLITLEDLKQEFPHQDTTTLQDLFARSIIKADLLALKAKGITA